MPVWFIQVFGALLLAGTTLAAYLLNSPLMLIESFGVGLAMLGIRRLLRERAEEDSAELGVVS